VSQGPADLPTGWASCRLGDVVNYGSTQTVAPDQIEALGWVLELEDIEKDTSRILQRMSFSQRRSRSSKNRFFKGDVLYGKLRPYLNKVVRADHDGYCTTEIVPLRPGPEVHAGFLFHWLKHPRFQEYVKAASHGMGMPRLGTAAAKAAPFVLAPFHEQERIADKLDMLLTRVYASCSRLERIEPLIKRFRQAVLRAAVSGVLTDDWRGTGTQQWNQERAADVCSKVQSGSTPKEGFSHDGVPFVKVYNIVEQRIAFEEKPQFIAREVHAGSCARSVTLPGDVLMNIVGPPLGKVAIVPDSHPEWNINQALCLFRPGERLSARWLYYVLCAGKNIEEIANETRGSAGQVNISLSQCRDFVFPIPPMNEQKEITRRIESLFGLAESLQSRSAVALERLRNVAQALLVKAFRGELVPHHPDDEPASRLLERIKSRRANAQPVAKQLRSPKGTPMNPKSSPREDLGQVVKRMPLDHFTFEELRAHAKGNYESLKDELFGLLADPAFGLVQFFDDSDKMMKLRRVSK
jgi:type I restriction enzyme, S subunit